MELELIELHKKYQICDTSNKSPLRYPRGKTRACEIIDTIVSQYIDIGRIDTIISPFVGGGSFEFYLQNKYGCKLIINDKFTPLYNFWKQVKVNKKILCGELRRISSVSKQQFMDYRSTIMTLNDNILQQSIQYFVINRCLSSGSILSGRFSEESSSRRFSQSSINRIELLDFTNIDIHNMDFYDFINECTVTEETLLFLDPPYYLENNGNGDIHEVFNHQLLFDIINTKKKWILTYNDCEYIRKMYTNYEIIEVYWKYSSHSSKTSSELIIISR